MVHFPLPCLITGGYLSSIHKPIKSGNLMGCLPNKYRELPLSLQRPKVSNIKKHRSSAASHGQNEWGTCTNFGVINLEKNIQYYIIHSKPNSSAIYLGMIFPMIKHHLWASVATWGRDQICPDIHVHQGGTGAWKTIFLMSEWQLRSHGQVYGGFAH